MPFPLGKLKSPHCPARGLSLAIPIMPTPLKQLALKTVATLFIAGMGFYLGCLAYVLVTNALFYLFTMTMIVLHILGIDSAVLQVISYGFNVARNHEAAMYGADFAFFCGLAMVTPGHFDFQRKKYPGVLFLSAVTLLFVAGVLADFHYGVTPLSEISFRESVYNARRLPVEHHFSVENVMHLEDRLSGVLAETEGILDYQPQMKRFILRSASQEGRYVKLFFFKGQRTIFSEMHREDKPRYHEMLTPFIGRRVRVLGKCVNGQIDVDIADMQEIAEFSIKRNEALPFSSPQASGLGSGNHDAYPDSHNRMR